MSGGSKRRRSKWDDKDPEAFPEDYYDRAPSQRPREPFSPGKSSRRHDSRSRESIMTLDREGNCTRISPVQDDWRPSNSSRSPRNGWGRSHRISRSRSRSRSQSPAHNFRRESAVNVRSRNRSGASGQVCREFAAGRCRRGHSCHFLHQDAHDSRQPLEHGPPDDFEVRRQRTGSSRYSPDDINDNSIRAEKSTHICNDFFKGRCRKGDTCRFVHHDSSADVFEKGPVEEVYRNRDHEHRGREHRDRSRDIYPDHDHRSRDIYPDRDHRSKDVYPDRDLRSKDAYPDRDHGNKVTYTDRDRGSKDIYPDRGHGSRDAYSDRDHGSRDTYPDHDHGNRDTHLERDHRSRDRYSDNDYRRKDINTDRNHENEPHRRGEIPCKFFASGNCRNGNRCRFSHQVQEVFSSERSRNEKRDTDRNFDGSRDWNGPRWSDATVVSAAPTVPGWEEDKFQKKEVIAVRIQDDEGGLHCKNGGPSWNDAISTPIAPVVQGWGDDNIEIREAAKDATGAQPSNDSWNHDMLIKPIWDPPATNVDKSQIQEQVDPLQWKTESNTPIISLSKPRVDVNSGDMEISPKDVKQQTIFNSLTLQTPCNSNIAFAPVQGTAGETSSFEKHYHTDVFGQQNPSFRDNKPISYSGERGDVVGDHNGPSVIQNQATTVPQGQAIFQSDKNVNVHPIPTMTPPIQSQAPDLSHAPQVDGMQEVLYQPLSSENKIASGPPSFGLASSAPAPGSAAHGVSNEQLAQLSHITASLTQLLENRQQFSQLSSSVSSHGMPNIPDLAAPLPPVSGAPLELNQAPETLKQYDPANNSIDRKNATNEIHNEAYNLNPQEHLGQSKDEENVKVTAEFKPADNGPSQDVGLDDGADEGKNLKDKGIRPFKFALAEFVKELLKPSWKDGQVSKEAYKTIVKKVVDKVMETLGPQIPQTKEKIDLYLSSSKPKIDKLVQAYVGKHRKG